MIDQQDNVAGGCQVLGGAVALVPCVAAGGNASVTSNEADGAGDGIEEEGQSIDFALSSLRRG